jgi:Fe2+ or Zn2+ uptake regulation protein
MPRPKKEKQPRGFQRAWDRDKVLEVLSLQDKELKTSTLKKRVVEKYPEYEAATLKWFKEMLYKSVEEGKVTKINKEDDVAIYWKLS